MSFNILQQILSAINNSSNDSSDDDSNDSQVDSNTGDDSDNENVVEVENESEDESESEAESESDSDDDFLQMLAELAGNMQMLSLTLGDFNMIAHAIAADGKFNIAICGRSGTGKSSIINAIRGVADWDSSAARVGEVETTVEVTPYPHPAYPHIILWDVPGAGTPDCPADNYFVDKILFKFDCLMIVMADRFCQIDLAIAQEAERISQPLLFVRNKADLDIGAKMRKGLTYRQAIAEFRERTVEACRQEILSKVDLDDAYLYLVSCLNFGSPQKHIDEQNLIDKIVELGEEKRH